MAKTYGLERLGFLTLTIGGKQSPCHGVLQRRFHSLRTHVLSKRYERSVWVVERGEKTGRLHLHGVVVLPTDIRTNRWGSGPVDFKAFEEWDYRSANEALRAEWAFWRKTAPEYRFGRTELLPVKSTADGVAYYVGGYISKAVHQRLVEDKGKRFVRFVGYTTKVVDKGQVVKASLRKAGSRFAWVNDRSFVWRKKVEAWARTFGMHSMDEITARCGPRWAYHFQAAILGTEVERGTVFPSEEAARVALDEGWRFEAMRHNAVVNYARERGERITRTFMLTEVYDYEQRPF